MSVLSGDSNVSMAYLVPSLEVGVAVGVASTSILEAVWEEV